MRVQLDKHVMGRSAQTLAGQLFRQTCTQQLGVRPLAFRKIEPAVFFMLQRRILAIGDQPRHDPRLFVRRALPRCMMLRIAIAIIDGA